MGMFTWIARDGVNIWDSTAKLLGKIMVESGGVVLLNEEKLWLAEVSGLVVSGTMGNVTKML